MKLDDIYEEWSKDCVIVESNLGQESLKISRTHNKYLRLLTNERLLHKRLFSQHKKLYNEKHDFYVDGPTKEQNEKGWVFPSKGKILKAEAQRYLDADDDLIKSNLALAVQQEKVDVLTEIIKTLNKRSFDIKNCLEWNRFINGEN